VAHTISLAENAFKNLHFSVFLARNSFKSSPQENYNIKDTKVYVYLIAVIELRKNSHKFPLGTSFCLMDCMYSLKTEMIFRHCSTKDCQQLLYIKRERAKGNNLRDSYCEINFGLLNLRIAETN
jgi:hypothetical protein